MDLYTALIGLGCFLVSAVAIYIISVFGTKEKTYEEAIEEQRQRAERAFLTTRPEPKVVKDKKFKKFGRKSKEKLDKFSDEGDEIVEADNRQPHSGIKVFEPLVQKEKIEDKKKSKEKLTKGSSATKVTAAVKPSKSSTKVEPHVYTTLAPVHVNSDVKTFMQKSNVHAKQQASAFKQEETTLKKQEPQKQQTASVKQESTKQQVEGGKQDAAKKPAANVKQEATKQLVANVKQEATKQLVANVKQEATRPQATGVKQHTSSVKEETSKQQTANLKQESAKQQASSTKQDLSKQKETTTKSLSLEQLKRVDSSLLNDVKAQASPGKRAKKSKSDVNIALDGQPNMVKFVSQIKEALLSHTEIQTLIDILLNKQQNGTSEWLQKGQKQETVPQLKKQLSEQEQKLVEARQLTQTTASKLKEMRQELNQEMTRSGHSEKMLRDKNWKQDQEIQAFVSRLKSMKDQHTAEVTALKSKVEQLKATSSQSNISIIQKLQEENVRLNHAIAQAEQHSFAAAEVPRLQLEIEQLHGLKEQHEARQLGMQQSQLELQTRIQQLEQHIQAVDSSKGAEMGDEMSGLQIQIHNVGAQLNEALQNKAALEAQIYNYQAEINSLKNNLEQSDQAGKEVVMLQQNLGELRASVQSGVKTKASLEAEIHKLLQDLQAVNNQLHEKEIQINVLAEEKVGYMAEISDLKSAVELQSNKQNGDIHEEFSSQKQQLILDEKNKALKDLADQLAASHSSTEKIKKQLEETNGILQQIQRDYNDKAAEVETTKMEISQRSAESETLTAEVETQREKNNDLRQKNWKTIEALKATEKAAEERASLLEKSFSENLNKIKAEQESTHKVFLQRIFPFIEMSPELPYDSFLSNYEKQVTRYAEELNQASKFTSDLATLLKDSEDTRASLEAQIDHYKTVMTETEGILKKLQASVEEEEENWKAKLKVKEEELAQVNEERRLLAEKNSALKESLDQIKSAEEMQEKLKELQERLQGEENEKRALETKYMQTQEESSQFFRNLENNEKELLAVTARAEQLQKEIESLRSDIEKEKQCCKEMQSQNVKLNSLVKIGQDSLRAEQDLAKDLQSQLDQLQTINNGTTNGSPVKEPITIDQVESCYSESNSPSNPPSSPGRSSTSSSKKLKRKSKRVDDSKHSPGCFG